MKLIPAYSDAVQQNVSVHVWIHPASIHKADPAPNCGSGILHLKIFLLSDIVAVLVHPVLCTMLSTPVFICSSAVLMFVPT